MKTIIIVASLLTFCSAADDLRADDSFNRPLRKPSGKPLEISSDVSPLEQPKPQFEYISSLDQNSDVKPTFDYISTPNVEQKPTVQYISHRPSSFGYINTYPNVFGYNRYQQKTYPGYPRFSYSSFPIVQQSGYQTGYQFVREPVRKPEQKIIRQYPQISQDSYQYPIQYKYQYQYPQYQQYTKYPRLPYYTQQYEPSHAYSYLPSISPFKK